MSYIGTTEIGKMFLGSVEIDKAYLGSTLVFSGESEPRVPVGYTELEYVTTDSHANLDTGVAGNNNSLVINIVFMSTKYVKYGYVYGNYNTNDNYNIHRFMYNTSETSCLVNHNTKGANGTERAFTRNQKQTVSVTHSGFTRNGTSYALSGTSNGTNNSRKICLGAQYVGTSTYRDIGLRIYSFSIYNGTTPLIDLIPCKRDSDSVAGFYDSVSKSFKTSSTTTNFGAGPAV